ncbi:hypothetical protein [Streptomyces sp. NPDC057428]|uniref:hypothetical protein n=1 Tax=Streptomyces sp. NPDC057428 TaxID=3346129 RepID=UPI003676E7FD
MPGQRKRKRQQRAGTSADPGDGHWQVVFETQDELEWRTHLRDLRARPERIDAAGLRIDTLCGRLTHPTTYRLSLFMSGPAGDPGPDRDSP